MTTSAKPINILIADDQPFLRDTVRKAIPMDMAHCFTARDGGEAIGALNGSELISVFVTDHMMEVATGLQVLQLLRSGYTAAARNLPVLLVTGYGEKRIVKLAKKLDVNAILAKPVSLQMLANRIQFIYSHPIAVKEPDHYRAVSLAEDGNDGHPGRQSPGVVMRGVPLWYRSGDLRKSPEARHNRRTRLVKIESLSVAMVLAQNIYGPTGTLVAGDGMTLSDRLIARLHDLAAKMPEIAVVEVYQSSADPNMDLNEDKAEP